MKSNKTLIIIAVAILLVVCCISSTCAGVMLLSNYNESKTSNHPDNILMTEAEKFREQFRNNIDSAPETWEAFTYSGECQQYKASLKLESFTMSYQSSYDVNKCSKDSTTNYVSFLAYDKANPKYNESTNPLFTHNIGIGYFNIDKVSDDLLIAKYNSSDSLISEFMDSLKTNLPVDTVVTQINNDDLELDYMNVKKHDYKVTFNSERIGFGEGNYILRVALIPNIETGHGVVFLAMVKQEGQTQEDIIANMDSGSISLIMKSIRFTD